MKKTGKLMRTFRLISFALVCSLLLMTLPAETPPVLAASTSSAEIQKMQAELAQIEKDRQYYENMITSSQSGAQTALAEKNYFDSLISSTEKKIEAAKALIAQYETDIAAKETDIASMQEEYDRKYELFKERLRVSYEEGNVSYLQIILSAESFTDFLVSVERVSDVLEYENTLMDELERDRLRLNDELAALNNEKADAVQAQADLEADETKYTSLSAQRDDQIAQYANDAEKYMALYDDAKAAESELDKEIERKLADLAKQSTASYVGGEFIWPLDPSIKYVSSGYGWRTLWGRKDFHLGIDIPAALGSNVYASNSGTVVTATFHSSYGYYVLIDHGGGRATLYAHNSKLLVSAGDTVKQGDVIAKVGTTGSSSGYHCHFEIRVNGSTVDPLSYSDFAPPAGYSVAS